MKTVSPAAADPATQRAAPLEAKKPDRKNYDFLGVVQKRSSGSIPGL